MKVIIGLGNPGNQYLLTRHNAGIIFTNWLAKQKLKVKSTTNTTNYTLHIINQNRFLCIPETFMNLSGKAISSLIRKYPTLKANDIIVVHDDLQHKIGNVRIKNGGSTQGHNGVESIARELKTKQFKRLQLGIDRPNSRDPQIVSKYVLSKFTKDQFGILKQNFSKAIQLLKQNQFL